MLQMSGDRKLEVTETLKWNSKRESHDVGGRKADCFVAKKKQTLILCSNYGDNWDLKTLGPGPKETASENR
jgi:hypothetical protein